MDISATLNTIEEKLGNNLVALSDALDLQIRQKDARVMQMVRDFNDAWTLVCKLRKHHATK